MIAMIATAGPALAAGASAGQPRAPRILVTWQVNHFPKPQFTLSYAEALQRHGLATWPGPTGLVEAWHTQDLSEAQRVGVLIGASAHHDRQLLPIYLEAVRMPSERVRKAAAYGYRLLIGDAPPSMAIPITDAAADRLAGEMRAVGETLRRHPLVELWLASALHDEGVAWPGWRGVVLNRKPTRCLQAVESVAQAEDADLLITAYHLTDNLQTRNGLLRLIEALSLKQFLFIPKGDNKGWGIEVWDEAHATLQAWLATTCGTDPEQRLVDGLEQLGAHGVQPFSGDACSVWEQLADEPVERWWYLAARQLYWCGGPYMPLAALRAETEQNRAQRAILLEWYQRLGTTPGLSGRRLPPRPPAEVQRRH
jgi:hypothetical protein